MRKKASSQLKGKQELSMVFDSRASDPIHVNNLQFGNREEIDFDNIEEKRKHAYLNREGTMDS